MNWSKVNDPLKKPFGWWYHKLLCEFWYNTFDKGRRYYKHLNKLCEYGFDLYGRKMY